MALKTISPDAELENADWTKKSWDFPPWLSPEFFAAVGIDVDLDKFRASLPYKYAVEQGLIVDDEWIGPSPEDELTSALMQKLENEND